MFHGNLLCPQELVWHHRQCPLSSTAPSRKPSESKSPRKTSVGPRRKSSSLTVQIQAAEERRESRGRKESAARNLGDVRNVDTDNKEHTDQNETVEENHNETVKLLEEVSY